MHKIIADHQGHASRTANPAEALQEAVRSNKVSQKTEQANKNTDHKNAQSNTFRRAIANAAVMALVLSGLLTTGMQMVGFNMAFASQATQSAVHSTLQAVSQNPTATLTSATKTTGSTLANMSGAGAVTSNPKATNVSGAGAVANNAQKNVSGLGAAGSSGFKSFTTTIVMTTNTAPSAGQVGSFITLEIAGSAAGVILMGAGTFKLVRRRKTNDEKKK